MDTTAASDQRLKAGVELFLEGHNLVRSIAGGLPHEHYFCYDYGMGAFPLAREANGLFEWLYSKR